MVNLLNNNIAVDAIFKKSNLPRVKNPNDILRANLKLSNLHVHI